MPKADLMREVLQNPLTISRELNNRSLYHFLQYFWDTVSPHKFQGNWHIEYLCRELEEIALRVGTRQIRLYDLLINIPPGSTKTITVSIMFPAWCWTKWHWMRFIAASYSEKLSLESAEYCRDLIRSTKFRELYPEIGIKEDKDIKSNFKIVKHILMRNGKTLPNIGGGRYSTSVGGTLLGFHGDILIWDDPLNPTQAASDIELANAIRWLEQTLSTRKTNKEITATIGIMQRLNQGDPSGHLLAKQKENLKHICIPGECRNYSEYINPPSLIENYKDELMDPVRLSWKALKDLEADLGQYGYAGQIGQNPVPPGGGMFKVDYFTKLASMPNSIQIVKTVRYWDKAQSTEKGAPYTAGVKMSLLMSGKWVVEDVKRGRWGSDEREKIIRIVAEADGKNTQVWIEQEPGPIWEEELVQMADGLKKKLKDIRKGDFIINGKGNLTKVLGVHIQGELDCLKIITDSGRIVHISNEHPFLTPDGWVNANKLDVGTVLALKTDIQVSVKTEVSLEESRLAGYMIGDGCCTWARKKEITCNANIVSSDEIEGLDIVHCADVMKFGIYIGGSKGWTYYLSGGARDWLKERGLAGKNTFNKRIPEWIITSSKESIANFLGAYFACDGSVSSATKKNSWVEYYSTNLELLKEAQSLLLRFGIYTMLRKRNYKDEYQQNRHFCYRLVMRNKDGSMGKFASQIPVYGRKNLKMNFKQIMFEQPYLPDPIIEIEKVGKLPCRCLTVSEGESFLLNDIVVHNSSGKEAAEGTIRNLGGFSVYAERPTGEKAYRADPFSVQVNNGNVMLLTGEWHRDFIEELRFFPYSTYKDQVDAASGAFSHLTQKRYANCLL